MSGRDGYVAQVIRAGFTDLCQAHLQAEQRRAEAAVFAGVYAAMVSAPDGFSPARARIAAREAMIEFRVMK